MGSPIVDLGNPDNWALVYNQTKEASYYNSSSYYPLPAFQLPFILHSPYLLVEAANIEAKPWWFLGCRLQQIVNVGVAPDSAATGLIKIPVNKPRVVRLPSFANDYLVKIEIPPWFDKMKISIWEYTGEIKDSTEELIIERSDVIRVDLTRIEAKINQLL